MEKKNVIWKILLVTGLMPFIIVISYGIYSAINGYSTLCILNCVNEYGFTAFRDSVILFSYIFWPIYVMGLVLIIISILKLKQKQ